MIFGFVSGKNCFLQGLLVFTFGKVDLQLYTMFDALYPGNKIAHCSEPVSKNMTLLPLNPVYPSIPVNL